MKANLRYLSKVLYRYDKVIFFLFAVSIIVETVIPYVVILLPKFILQGILMDAGVQWWIFLVICFGIGGTILYIVKEICGSQLKAHITAARNCCFGDMLNNKMLKIKYELLECPDVQELCFRANMLFWSENNGVMGVFLSLKSLMANVLTLTGIVGILASFSIILPIILALSTLLNMFLLKKAQSREGILRPLAAEKEREKEYLDGCMRNVDYGRDIRIYGLVEWLHQWYDRVCVEKEEVFGQIQKGYKDTRLAEVFISALRDVFVYGFLIYAVVSKYVRIDDFLMYLSCASSFSSLFIGTVSEFMNIKQFLMFTEDFKRAMELEEDAEAQEQDEKRTAESIYFKNVSYNYSGCQEKTLKNLSFSIRQGEHIAIVGANGAGKTTLIKLLTGLYEPSEGSIEIYDPSGEIMDNGKNFSLFAAVMQRIFQYAFTLEENITFKENGRAKVSKLDKVLVDSGFKKILDTLPKGLNTNLRKDFDLEGVTLSMGQAQLLALARALYKDTSFVVLDEPTASLDPIAEADIYEKFDKLFSGKTCIFISHRLSSVKHSDRIMLLDSGEIVASGTHEDLIVESDLYRRMWDAQSRPYIGRCEENEEIVCGKGYCR